MMIKNLRCQECLFVGDERDFVSMLISGENFCPKCGSDSDHHLIVGDQPIGYLCVKPGEQSHRVVGGCCAERVEHTSPVYRENIFPYIQSCAFCGKVLVEGAQCAANKAKCARAGEPHTHWPELFDGRA